MKTLAEPSDFSGAMTLLRDCVGGTAGQRLLIVSEPNSSDYYDVQSPKLTATAGRVLGMKVYETEFESFDNNNNGIAILLETLSGFDHVVFFSRVGDQVRFSTKAGMPSSTMCYTLNHEALNSKFGTACHYGMGEIKKSIDDAFASASHIRVTCPRGTDYSGHPDWGVELPTEVSLKRFPLLVPRPIPAKGFCGRIVLSRFLIGTGSHFYEPYYLALSTDVFACVKDNKITHFEGDATDVKRVEDHYRHVSELYSIEPWYVDSWHAGIHPGCHFDANAEADILRWSGTAFGNPRILHFHTCGEYAPGEISWNILDPTIYIDDVPVWEDGQLYPDRLSNGNSVLEHHPDLAMLFKNPFRNVGLIG